MDLTITGVEKRFGRVEALRGVEFAVNTGEFFALLGPSGAGKTTLLRIIAGIEQADAGRRYRKLGRGRVKICEPEM